MPIPPPATAARRLAALLVERRQLTPPVPVRELLQERAQVEAATWPQEDVDAVVVGLGQRRPDVFYRLTGNSLRTRFTLAHELGHVVIPWHLGSADCSPGTGVLDLGVYGQEEQADVFASCLLLPDRWLLHLLRGSPDDMTTVLESLEIAEVTTRAALLALRRVLLAGWAFVAYQGDFIVSSAGTRISPSVRAPQLARVAADSGRARLNGYSVNWYRLAPPAELPPIDLDTRTTTQLLQDAIALHVADDAERVRLMQRVNGRVGGVLREAGGRPALETFATLKYSMSNSEDVGLLEEPEFVTWLARKARDIETGNTKKTQRRR